MFAQSGSERTSRGAVDEALGLFESFEGGDVLRIEFGDRIREARAEHCRVHHAARLSAAELQLHVLTRLRSVAMLVAEEVPPLIFESLFRAIEAVELRIAAFEEAERQDGERYGFAQ